VVDLLHGYQVVREEALLFHQVGGLLEEVARIPPAEGIAAGAEVVEDNYR